MENLPELYEIFQGEVANVTEYGAFIKIPGCRKQGLVHRTHMSSAQVDRPSEVVDVGERVWVKVIGREEIVCLLEFLRFPKNNLIQLQTKDGKEKISLSMKVVHQGTGKDLDSNNVMLEQDERKRREFKDYSKQKITLEAVLNTVCKKCGCKGHFAKDCFMQPGGTKYSLLPEEEEEDVKKDTEQVGVRSAKKKKKEKEKKKRKHSRDTQDSESDSSECSNSDSSNSGPSKKKGRNEEKSRKTSKKKRKHKKHKHKHTGKDKN